MSPFAWETSLHWSAVALYIAGTVGFAWALIFARPEKVRGALWVTAAGLLPHTAALLLRYLRVGHGPYMLKYEVLSSNAWIAIAMLLLFVWRRPNWAPVALVALPAAILMMGFGLFTNPEARSLPPTLRSLWLVFHVVFNKLAVGAFPSRSPPPSSCCGNSGALPAGCWIGCPALKSSRLTPSVSSALALCSGPPLSAPAPSGPINPGAATGGGTRSRAGPW